MTNEDTEDQVPRRLDAVSTELIAVHVGKFTARERNRRIRKIKDEIKSISTELGVDASALDQI